MKERILQIMQSHKMTQREFASALGISPSSLSSIFNGHTSPTNNHVQAIHRRFPDISIAWLMFGEGEMTAETAPEREQETGNGNTGESVRHTDAATPVVTTNPGAADAQVPVREAVAPNQVIIRETVKYIDKPQRRITEIRVFYDDGTYDTFSAPRD